MFDGGKLLCKGMVVVFDWNIVIIKVLFVVESFFKKMKFLINCVRKEGFKLKV